MANRKKMCEPHYLQYRVHRNWKKIQWETRQIVRRGQSGALSHNPKHPPTHTHTRFKGKGFHDGQATGAQPFCPSVYRRKNCEKLPLGRLATSAGL